MWVTFAQRDERARRETRMSIKKLFLVAVTLSLLALPVLWSVQAVDAAPNGQDDLPLDTITVTGSGLAYGAPDIARLGLGVEAINADVLTAVDDANGRMNAVIQALQDAGVAAEDIRTENYSIYQERNYGPQGSPADASSVYHVSNTVAITVREIDRVGELLSTAVASGANIVNYMQFDIADRSALESEARDSAVADARARADQLAATLGLAVGRPVRVVENAGGYYPMYEGMGGGGGGGVAASVPPISQGTLSVSMSVTITYAVEPAN
jgi:uncharacterized protein YggE